jgi:hypothetical protein
MDFLDPTKKRRHNQQLYIGYALMVVLILTASTLLLLLTFGFSFDRQTRSLIQNGLVFVDPNPIAADVYVNDERKGRGDQRLVLPAGSYNIEIQEDGYRSWRRSIELSGGELQRFAYPFLFAENITTSTYRTFNDGPRLMTTSPDRRWMLIQEVEQIDAFVLYDLNQKVNLPSFFTLPPGLMRFTDQSGDLSIVEWSNDNRHVVLRHEIPGLLTDFILLDRSNPNESQNLTTRFSDLNFSDISLVDKRFDRYHLFDRDNAVMYQAQLAADQVAPLIEGVITYRSHGSDTVLYLTPDTNSAPSSSGDQDDSDSAGAGEHVMVNMLQGDQSYELLRLPTGDARAVYYIDLARFRGDWYVIVASTANNQALIYRDPIQQLRQAGADMSTIPLVPMAVLRTDKDIQQIKFSANARNIMVQAGNRFHVYDIERDEVHEFGLGEGDEMAVWMDGHRITTTTGDRFRVADFDGRNVHDLQSCRSSFSGFFDRNYEFMYCVAPTDQNSYGALIRSALRPPEET